VSNYQQLFSILDDLLIRYQELWQPRAFHLHDLPWRHQYPALRQKLDALSIDEVINIDSSFKQLVNFFADDIPESLIALENLPATENTSNQP
jgi:hypothetical protein